MQGLCLNPFGPYPAKLYTRPPSFGTFILQLSAMLQGGSPLKHRALIALFYRPTMKEIAGREKEKSIPRPVYIVKLVLD